jgi:7-carboxy-7-deazaguanine synthase
MQIYSIFNSINGEVGAGQGMFSTFVRFAGCMEVPCKWCDTTYALNPESGKDVTPTQVLNQVKLAGNGWPHVTITGGEPLMQKEQFNDLVHLLWREDYIISVETNGAHNIFDDISTWKVKHWVVDYKTPSSGVSHMMKDELFPLLCKDDWIKLVIADREDYKFAKEKIHSFVENGCQARLAFSPMSDGQVSPSQLMHWLSRDNLYHIVLNLQLHKLASLNEPE